MNRNLVIALVVVVCHASAAFATFQQACLDRRYGDVRTYLQNGHVVDEDIRIAYRHARLNDWVLMRILVQHSIDTDVEILFPVMAAEDADGVLFRNLVSQRAMNELRVANRLLDLGLVARLDQANEYDNWWPPVVKMINAGYNEALQRGDFEAMTLLSDHGATVPNPLMQMLGLVGNSD